jgi:hypothetical protein
MKLQDWFIEKDYGIGVALLGTLSKNRILIQNLSRKQNPAKLEYELRKIAKEKGMDLTVKVEDQKPEDVDPNAGKQTGTDGSTDEKKGSHSDQVIDQMNADQKPDDLVKEKLDELESGADEIVSDKLSGLESDAEDIVSDNVNDLKITAQDIIEDKISEFESQVEEIMSGKLEVIRNGRKVKYEDLSPEMQARWTQNKDAYKEIRALHEKLKLMENGTAEDRQPLTQRICDMDDSIRDNWVEIDAYMPVTTGSATEAPVIDHKRIGANRKFISTNLKKLPEQQDPVKAAIVVAELQKRYNELKAAGETVAPETIEELTKAGIQC